MSKLWTRRSPIEAFTLSEAAIIDEASANAAEREISSWRGYEPSPVFSLTKLARQCGVASIHYKDEGNRFGLGSFKALGGAYAVCKLATMARNSGKGDNARMTVACATDGNHGRSVAWAASLFGLDAVIYVHSEVSESRKAEIERYGARVERISGVYDDAVRQVQCDADRFGWTIVSDTSYPGYVELPSFVMQGYTVMSAEARRQLTQVPTHIFVQCGVGALPAALCAYYRLTYGGSAPKTVVVEPENAACLLASARAGKLTTLDGDISTIMAGLACGHPSMLAWAILSRGAFAFMSLPDVDAVHTMRLLASDTTGALPIIAGETGAAGLAGFLVANRDSSMRARLHIDKTSRILVIGTERDTDPQLYERIISLRGDEVSAFCGNRAWSMTSATAA